jgi:hypothetical protein
MELNEIKERCEMATPGPWIYDERVGFVAVYHGEQANCISETEDRRLYYANGFHVDDKNGKFDHWEVDPQDCADAEFIAHARQDIPDLIADNEQKDAEIERIHIEKSNNETTLINQMEEYKQKYNSLKVIFDMYGGEDGIVGAFAEIERLTQELAAAVNAITEIAIEMNRQQAEISEHCDGLDFHVFCNICEKQRTDIFCGDCVNTDICNFKYVRKEQEHETN